MYNSIIIMSQPFVVPDINGTVPQIQPLRVPENISGENIREIPDWTYKRFSITDIFQSKLGISATTSLLTFALLAYMNPPFIQQKGDNEIEIRKPSMAALYTLSILVFITMMLVPVNPAPLGSK